MISKTKLEHLQWRYAKLQRARDDVRMIRHNIQEEDRRSDDAEALSRAASLIEGVMWNVETDIRFEKRIGELFTPRG